MIKEIEYKTPLYESIQVGEISESKWETSDGKQFEYKSEAEWHEFYQCKVKQRGIKLPVENAILFDLTSADDLMEIEKTHLYDSIKKYSSESLLFPNTYVMYQEDDPNFNYDDYELGYNPDIHVYLVTLEEYKKILITAIKNLK